MGDTHFQSKFVRLFRMIQSNQHFSESINFEICNKREIPLTLEEKQNVQNDLSYLFT